MDYNKIALEMCYPNIKFIKGTNVAVYHEDDASGIADNRYHIINVNTGNTMDYFHADSMRQAGEWLWFTSNYCCNSNHVLVNAKSMDTIEFCGCIQYRRFGKFQVWNDGTYVVINGPSGLYRFEEFRSMREIDGVIPLSINLKNRVINFGASGVPLDARDIINKYSELNGGFREVWKAEAGPDHEYYIALSKDNIKFIYDQTGIPVERGTMSILKARFDQYIASLYNNKTKLVLQNGKIPA